MLDSHSCPRARRICNEQVMFLKMILAVVLLHSSKLVHAQAGVIDDSQYIAGPQQRAATRAPRRTPVPANNATYHAPALAPTVASPGVPVSTPSVPQHTNITAVQQPLSANASSPGVGPAQAVQAKAADGNATGAGHASLRPANRYHTAPPPPEPVDVTVKQQHPSANASSPGVGSAQAVHAKAAASNSTTAAHASVTPANRYQSTPPLPLAQKAANETAGHRAPVAVPAKVGPPSANDTSSGVGSAPALHAKAAPRNATAQHAGLRPANRYQTTPPPPQAAKNTAEEKAGGGAAAPASAKAAQQVPLAGVSAQQPSTRPLQPGGSDEAGSASSANPDSGVGAPLPRSAAPPDTEQGALPAESPQMMAASPRQELALAEAPLLADSPVLVAAEAPVPAQATTLAARVPQNAARVPTSVEAPILVSNLSQAAAAGPDPAPAPAHAAVDPIPESVMGTKGPVAETPAPAFASAPAAVTAPQPARRHPESGMTPTAVLQHAAQVSVPVPAAEPAPEAATSKEEPDMAYASALQSPAVAPASATVAGPAPEHTTSRTTPEASSAAFLRGATLAPAPGAQAAPVAAAPAEAPRGAAFPPSIASGAVSAPVEVAGGNAVPPLDASAAAIPAVVAFPPDASAAAPFAEALHGAGFPPSDASSAEGAPVAAPRLGAFPPLDASAPTSPVGQPHHGALQVALAQPAHTAAPPPESAPSPATGGHTTQAAAGSKSRAAALRQTIGVVQASVLSNRPLPAVPPSTASGVQALELAEAPATASAGAPAPLQEPPSAQQPATAGPAEAGSTTPSDGQEAATVAEAPRGNDAVVPSPGVGGVGERSAVQASESEPVAVRPAGEGLPGDNAAFFRSTGVLQPDAATPDNGTSTGLVKINFKSQALTSQLFRAAPSTGEPAMLQPFAAAYAPAPVGQVQPSAFGSYLRMVDINQAQSAQHAAQAPVLSAAYAPPAVGSAGAPGPAIAVLQPQMGAYKVAASPEAAGSLLGDQASAMPAPETARTVAFGHATYSFGAAKAPNPGQRALEQLLSAASPHIQPGQAQAFTSGYFDVWAAPAPCDGFFSIRARRAPLGVQPSPQHSGGAMPASRYGGGETLQPVSPVRPSVPAPAPGRSLSLHPLGAQTSLAAPGPAPIQLATAQPNQAPIAHATSETHMAQGARDPSQVALGYAPSPAAAYHAGYYAGLQAAHIALAAATNAPAPAPSEAATSAATLPATSTTTMALAAAPVLAGPPAKGPRQQSLAKALFRGVYGYYGGYVARAPVAQGAEVAHAPVVREYPAEGMPAPVAAPGPSEGMVEHAVSPASYGTYGTGVYAYAPERQAGASYAPHPRGSTDVLPAEAPLVQAYAPAAAQPAASPYAGYGAAAPRGAYSMYAAHPQAYYVPAPPRITAYSAPAFAPATSHSGSDTPTAAPASATEAPPDAPVPAPSVAAALSPKAAATGQPIAKPALAPSPGTAPVPSALQSTTRASVGSPLAPTPATAPEAAVAPAYAIATSSALAYAPAPVSSAIEFITQAAVSSALAPRPSNAPEAAGGHATATSPPAYAPASAPVPSAVPRTSHATLNSALAPAPAITAAPASAPAHASATSAPALAPAPHGHALAAGLALNTAVATSPVQGAQQSSTQAGTQSACSKCGAYGADRPPSVQMSMLDGSELAQFSTSEGVPANLVYFVADVAFSPAPLSFTPQQISAENGTIIDVYQQDDCGHYLVKGYVEQPESGDPMRTDIVLSISDGAVFDCEGEAFPGTILTSSVLNRPTGSLHTPSLVQSASGPVSNQSQVFLTLTFSQPVSSVSPVDISVKLTQTQAPATQAVSGMAAPMAGGQNRRRLAEVPALPPAEAACSAVHNLTMLQKPDSPQAAFAFLLDISDCFLGLVGVDFIGTVHNSNGAENLPVTSLHFWQVNAKQNIDNIADSSIPH